LAYRPLRVAACVGEGLVVDPGDRGQNVWGKISLCPLSAFVRRSEPARSCATWAPDPRVHTFFHRFRALAERYFAMFLAVSAFTLAVASLVSVAWLDVWDRTIEIHVNHAGLFDSCWESPTRKAYVNVPYSLTPRLAPEPHTTCCSSTYAIVLACWRVTSRVRS
jgi:hypothetical protein